MAPPPSPSAPLHDQAKFKQKKTQAEQTAENVAESSAAAASVKSFAAFGMLLLGAAC